MIEPHEGPAERVLHFLHAAWYSRPMSVRMRHTRGHTGNRRSHHALSDQKVVKDKESGKLRLPHRLDESTGMYRGKQIKAVRAGKVHAPKVKGPDTTPGIHEHEHDHPHKDTHIDHANAETKGSRGIMGKLTGGSRPKARSGMGGQAS